MTDTVDRAGRRAQLYLTEAAGDERMRLLGFERAESGAWGVEGRHPRR